MQFHAFKNGNEVIGYVAHKVRPSGFSVKVSAWFDAQGNLTSAEAFDRRNVSRPIRPGGALWQAIIEETAYRLPN